MTLDIKDKQIEIKFNFKAEILFEEINKEAFKGANTSDWITMFYCNLLSCGGDGLLTYEEFVDWLSDNPTLLYDYIDLYTSYIENITKQRAIQAEAVADEKKRVKKTSRKVK